MGLSQWAGAPAWEEGQGNTIVGHVLEILPDFRPQALASEKFRYINYLCFHMVVCKKENVYGTLSLTFTPPWKGLVAL